MSTPLDRLRHHVTGAIERGEAVPVVEVPAVPDPIADTARALAGLWSEAARGEHDSGRAGRRLVCNARRAAIEDAARACGPQVYAAWCALVTGDAGRAPEVERG